MNHYSIRDLERISGIKAHTLRIWEKRYGLIKPGRTENNIRIYTDNEIRKILNVKTLLDNGWRISRVASLSDNQLIEQVFNYSNKKTEYENKTLNVFFDYYINELLYYGLTYDEVNFERAYLNAISKYGLIDTTISIIYPLLKKTGLLWKTEKAIPAQEHFISHLIQKKIISAIDALPVQVQYNERPFLLFLPENEYHEIPLLFSNYILRSKQINTFYLGPNIPLENVIEIGQKNNIDNYLSLIISNHSEKALEKLRNRIKNAFKALRNYTFYIGGSLEVKPVFSRVKNFIWMDDVKFLLNI
jgi:DNA-binding transcriptional MerR regulator